mmetsp:Transcript_21034/g.27649  ORF Transcript_21034/g.27649 Transcript_21034/m.27649 type:complete len:344 (-) Transcript_21034:172-1203(-)|eukprot:CAMPEP_0195269776 /NCGR_PEP_ID=MMETSP0706-20130129/13961_1 /TAXON_ID=33640 /ORGANISM="Asterionellopsis glacialis, Strain CCMP134" /LENGTH=343 /DNA_ID=CAMNT_0040324931 /DNA_START=82 /DNA_END=1113 /DNA_ORIENTATION=+
MAFNKMFVMLPVMLAARKLDSEDPNVVYWLRVAYACVQTVVIAIVGFTYIQAQGAASKASNKTIYVPPPPQPLADPNAKKRYTEVSFGAHVVSQSRSLLGSTLFGICLTTGLHWYKGMVMGLAIQSIMAPLNLLENALVKALILGKGIREEDKIFDEKVAGDLTEEDEVVDEGGNVVVRSGALAGSAGGKTDPNAKKSFEDILLDTWDEGNKADIAPLVAEINKKNCNYQVKESGWTPLMILSGLGAKGTGKAIQDVIALGGNPAIVDVEGWNAMHWAAFHGSAEAAKVLRDEGKLYQVKDKEGKTAIEFARAEKNDDVVKILEELEVSTESKIAEEGIRKRK